MDTVRGRGVDMGQGYHRRVLGSSYQVVQAVRGAHTHATDLHLCNCVRVRAHARTREYPALPSCNPPLHIMQTIAHEIILPPVCSTFTLLLLRMLSTG
jgi:hypothetical protein